ncbi:central repeat-containing protein [Elysia marginata]|uniref:Central repeat-containing protein n=1 Tax=Elysia marginata TaxID=1093978 RepID=A0AAV4ILZ6_9GAST|nr:central repeat-containing protein [Elysia marginata]
MNCAGGQDKKAKTPVEETNNHTSHHPINIQQKSETNMGASESSHRLQQKDNVRNRHSTPKVVDTSKTAESTYGTKATPKNNDTTERTNEAAAPERTNEAAAPGRTNEAAAPERTNEAAAPERNIQAAAPERINEAAAPERTNLNIKAAAPERNIKAAAPERTIEAAAPERTIEAAAPERTIEAAAPPERTNEAAAPERNIKAAAPERINEAAAPPERTNVAAPPERNIKAAAPERTNEAAAPERTIEATAPERNIEAAAPERNIQAAAHERTNEADAPERTNKAAAPERTNEAEAHESTNEATATERTNEATAHERNIENAAPERTTEAAAPEHTTEAAAPERTMETTPQAIDTGIFVYPQPGHSSSNQGNVPITNTAPHASTQARAPEGASARAPEGATAHNVPLATSTENASSSNPMSTDMTEPGPQRERFGNRRRRKLRQRTEKATRVTEEFFQEIHVFATKLRGQRQEIKAEDVQSALSKLEEGAKQWKQGLSSNLLEKIVWDKTEPVDNCISRLWKAVTPDPELNQDIQNTEAWAKKVDKAVDLTHNLKHYVEQFTNDIPILVRRPEQPSKNSGVAESDSEGSSEDSPSSSETRDVLFNDHSSPPTNRRIPDTETNNRDDQNIEPNHVGTDQPPSEATVEEDHILPSYVNVGDQVPKRQVQGRRKKLWHSQIGAVSNTPSMLALHENSPGTRAARLEIASVAGAVSESNEGSGSIIQPSSFGEGLESTSNVDRDSLRQDWTVSFQGNTNTSPLVFDITRIYRLLTSLDQINDIQYQKGMLPWLVISVFMKLFVHLDQQRQCGERRCLENTGETNANPRDAAGGFSVNRDVTNEDQQPRGSVTSTDFDDSAVDLVGVNPSNNRTNFNRTSHASTGSTSATNSDGSHRSYSSASTDADDSPTNELNVLSESNASGSDHIIPSDSRYTHEQSNHIDEEQQFTHDNEFRSHEVGSVQNQQQQYHRQEVSTTNLLKWIDSIIDEQINKEINRHGHSQNMALNHRARRRARSHRHFVGPTNVRHNRGSVSLHSNPYASMSDGDQSFQGGRSTAKQVAMAFPQMWSDKYLSGMISLIILEAEGLLISLDLKNSFLKRFLMYERQERQATQLKIVGAGCLNLVGSQPLCACKLDGSTVAVARMGFKLALVKCVRSNHPLQMERELTTKRQYSGMAYLEDNVLICSCFSQKQIDVVTRRGSQIETNMIIKDPDMRPEVLCYIPEGELIVAIVKGNNGSYLKGTSISGVNRFQTLIESNTENDWSVAHHGDVIVICCKNTNQFLQFTTNGELLGEINFQAHALDRPSSLTFDRKGRLFVANQGIPNNGIPPFTKPDIRGFSLS